MTDRTDFGEVLLEGNSVFHRTFLFLSFLFFKICASLTHGKLLPGVNWALLTSVVFKWISRLKLGAYRGGWTKPFNEEILDL